MGHALSWYKLYIQEVRGGLFTGVSARLIELGGRCSTSGWWHSRTPGIEQMTLTPPLVPK